MLQLSFKLVITIMLFGVGFSILQNDGLVGYWTNQWYLFFNKIDAQLTEIEQHYGIEVKHDIGTEAIPELWRTAPANGTAEPVSRLGLTRHLRILSHELQKYPANVIRHNLSTIFLLNSLSFFDVEYGGTTLGDAIYLTAGVRNEGYDDAYLASLFHHEMSSILFQAYQFPIEAWSANNSSEFHYAETDAQILRSIKFDTQLKGNENLYREGFLAAYGRSTLENDFNLYAEMAFTRPKHLQKLVVKYPKIHNKFELMKAFYLGISKKFFKNGDGVDHPEIKPCTSMVHGGGGGGNRTRVRKTFY
ncbi:hypothetical protein K8S19_04095 [bacterium]|nr:hypothetical protein [bacterium]